MDTEQELRPDLQQRLVEALYGPGVRRSDSIEELADALIAVAAARRSSDEQAEVDWRAAKLPCSVSLPPATTISAGCTVETLLTGLRARGMVVPLPAVAAGGVTAETIDFVMQYGGDCRDCADEFGTCPHNSLSCDVTSARKAIGFVLRAVEYGQRNGYLTAALAVGDEGIREDDLVTAVWELLRTVHQPTPKAGSDYWHVTAGKHVEFGKLITKLHSLLDLPTPPSRGEGE